MAGPRGSAPLEVACDESGSEGEKLVGGTTRMFAHASLDVEVGTAAACIVELRARTRSPAEEYKASVVLRPQNRAALTWLLGPSGPLDGAAHVHLVDKELYAARSLVVLLGGGTSLAAEAHRAGQGSDEWLGFLGSFNDLMRARGRAEVDVLAGSFFGLGGGLGSAAPLREVADLVARAAADPEPLLAPLADTARMTPRLQPLVPALVRAVRHWGTDGRPVTLVHDEQQALTPRRIAHVRDLLERCGDGTGPLVDVRLVDSRSDARVQLADLLAGAARRIAENQLDGRPDAELLSMLEPYVDPCT